MPSSMPSTFQTLLRTVRAAGPAGAVRRRALTLALAGTLLAAPVMMARGPVDLGAFAQGSAASPPGAVPGSGLNSLSGNYLAARLAGEEQDFATAARFYRAALADDPGNPVLMERAFTLSLASGDPAAAMPLADKLRPAVDGNRLGRLAMAVEAFAGGDTRKARKLLSVRSRSPLVELTNALVVAWSYAADKNVKQAFATLDSLNDSEMFAAFTTYNGGLIADLVGDHAAAVERLADAYAGDPGLPRVVVAYTRALVRAGKTKEATEVVNRFAELAHDGPVVDDLRADIAQGTSAPPIVPNARAGAAASLAALGATIGREGSVELASAYLNLALMLDAHNEFASVALAELFERLNKPEQAIRYYEALDPASPFYAEGQIQIALNLNALGRVDEARTHLEKVIAADPDDLAAVLALGAVLRSHEKFADAAKVYSATIERIKTPQPSDWLLFYNRGICFERMKEWPKAEPDFRMALKLSPDQPEVLNYLGYTWADMGHNLDEALGMIRKAVDLRPTDGAIVDSLGWALYRLGQYKEAVEHLERAVDLMPDDPTLNDHLGDAYWRVGRRVEARFQWAHARDMNPPADMKPKIEAKLKNGLPETGSETRSAAGKPAGEPKTATDAAPAAATGTAPADAGPADGKPANTGPADAKPADAKPADTKPADAKPAGAAPAETKPADTKPADAKPVDAKPAKTVPEAPQAGAAPKATDPAAVPAGPTVPPSVSPPPAQ